MPEWRTKRAVTFKAEVTVRLNGQELGSVVGGAATWEGEIEMGEVRRTCVRLELSANSPGPDTTDMGYATVEILFNEGGRLFLPSAAILDRSVWNSGCHYEFMQDATTAETDIFDGADT